GLFDEVWIATDSEIILQEIISHGGKAVMSKQSHESGSDRIAEAAAAMDADVIVNVQGDEPFINKKALEILLREFDDDSVQVASLMQVLNDEALVANPNYVKVCVDKKMNALFFSRSAIPYSRNKNIPITYYEHIGVYAFRKQALLDFTSWPVSPLEDAEKVECLRYLENGVAIKMVVTDFMGIEIDTPEDLERAKKVL
ncbi:MAG: 3-deoxy-manno-octulosonate cytidylyltransferase, partial [Bacteroidota bacterium]|nr:3-deoxy-manno-octulosonate cytidylyltransferase [Bacteroidota bacterium]